MITCSSVSFCRWYILTLTHICHRSNQQSNNGITFQRYDRKGKKLSDKISRAKIIYFDKFIGISLLCIAYRLHSSFYLMFYSLSLISIETTVNSISLLSIRFLRIWIYFVIDIDHFYSHVLSNDSILFPI